MLGAGVLSSSASQVSQNVIPSSWSTPFSVWGFLAHQHGLGFRDLAHQWMGLILLVQTEAATDFVYPRGHHWPEGGLLWAAGFEIY